MDEKYSSLPSRWSLFSWADKEKQEKLNEEFINMIKEDYNKFMQILLSNDAIKDELNFRLLCRLINDAMVTLSIEDFINDIINFANKNKAALLYYCALSIVNAPIDSLADAIIETGDVNYMYLFITVIPNAPKKKLAVAIVKTGNMTEINALTSYYQSYLPTEKVAIFNDILKLKNFEVICKFIPILDNITEESVNTIIDTFVKEGQPLESLTLSFIKKKDIKAFGFYIKNATPKITIDYLESALKHFENNGVIIDDLIDTIISMNDLEYCSLVLRIVPNLSQERVRKLVTIVVNQYPLNDIVKAQAINLFSNLVANNVVTKQNIDWLWIMLAKTALLNEQTLNISEGQFESDDDIKSSIL